MRITEPTTMLTDYALGVLGVWFGWRLVADWRRTGESSRLLWAISFFAMALAAVAGGTVHGFAEYLRGLSSSMLWSATIFSIGMASAAMLMAAVVARFTGALRVALLGLVVAKQTVFEAWIMFHEEFRFVVYDYAPSMLVVVLLLALPGRGGPVPGAGWVAAGVAVSFAAAGVQLGGISLHRHFNHNDLYHVVQMLGLYLLYRGGRRLRDRRRAGAEAL